MPPRAGSSTAEALLEAVFYFDLASPSAYLAAERIQQVLGEHGGMRIVWQPVLARGLPGTRSLDASSAELRSAIELRAARQGALPVRWPQEFPFDSEHAMLVATYAKSIGRATAFAQAAFRQAFAAGRSLADPDSVLIAAAACELHPAAVVRGAGLASVRQQLDAATTRAAGADVSYVPAVQVGSRVFVGEDAPEQAASGVASHDAR